MSEVSYTLVLDATQIDMLIEAVDALMYDWFDRPVPCEHSRSDFQALMVELSRVRQAISTD